MPTACSSFIVFGPATAGGRLYHGRSLDWPGHGVQPYACVLVCRPSEGVPFALAAWAGSAGGVTGMNAAGLTMGQMTSPSADSSLDAIPLFFLHREVLQFCRTLGQAVATVGRLPHSTGWNLMVGDGKIPDGRAFEVSARAVKVFAANDPNENAPPMAQPVRGLLRRTNHFVDAEMLAGQAALFGTRDVRLARTTIPLLNTGQRYSLIGRKVRAAYGRMDPARCRALLQAPPVADPLALHSVVMSPATGEWWLANATPKEPAWRRPWVHLDLRAAWRGK